jgi:uncharacterized protein YoxC
MSVRDRDVEQLANLIWGLCEGRPLIDENRLLAINLARALIKATRDAGLRPDEIDWEGEVIDCDLDYRELISLFHRWLRERIGKARPTEEFFKTKREIEEYEYQLLKNELERLESSSPEELGLSPEEYREALESLRKIISEYERKLRKRAVLPELTEEYRRRIEELAKQVSELESQATALLEKTKQIDTVIARVQELMRTGRLLEAVSEGGKAIGEVQTLLSEIESKAGETEAKKNKLLSEIEEMKAKAPRELRQELDALMDRLEGVILPDTAELKRKTEEFARAVNEAREKARERGRRILSEIERYITEKLKQRGARIYRLDPLDEKYMYMAARISYHRMHDEAVKSVIKELGGVIVEEREAAPPLKIIIADFSKAKIPAIVEEDVEKKWREMADRVRRLVEEWIRLYVKPEKAVGLRMSVERILKEAEGDVKALLRAGRPELADEEFRRALEEIARVVVSVAPRAREHPEIQRILPEAKAPPTVVSPEEMPETLMRKPPFISSEIWKWAKWFAKLERERMFMGVPSIYERPSVLGHPNPWISEFPPSGSVKNDTVYLHPACASGLAKIAEMAGEKVDPSRFVVGVSTGELRRLIDTIYSKVSASAREWLDLLRETLGI